MKRLAAFACATLLLFATLPALAVTIERVKSPAGIEIWLVQERKIPALSLEVAWRGGAAQEQRGNEGLATLAMALLDEGSGPDDEIAFHQKLDDLAIEMGFSAGRDSLRATMRTLTENRDTAFALLGQALNSPRFDSRPLELARRQMLTGLDRAEANPNSVAGRAWSAAAFPDHPYGRPTEGTKESLPALTREDLAGFVKSRMARDNMVVAAVGDVSAAEIGTLVDKALAQLPATAAPDNVAEVAPATQAQPIVIKREIPQSVVVFGTQGVKRLDADYYPSFVLNYVLGGGGFASRLMEEVREKRGLAYSVYSYLQPMEHAALHAGGVATRNDAVAESLRLIRAEFARVRESGLTAEELANAKAYITGSFPLQLTSNGQIAGMLVSIQIQKLGIDYIDRYPGYINAVTLDDVNRVAKRLLQPDNLLTVIVGQPQGIDG
jgi:zinc protease